MLIVIFALIFSLLLVQLNLNWFNQLADKEMSLPWLNPIFWASIIGFTLFTGLISGSYPAFYLSSFKPVEVLKGTFKAGKYASLPRKFLVVLQFTVSVALIIGTLVVFRQIQFAKNRPVGYDREGLIYVHILTDDLKGHYDALKNDLLITNVVENVATSGSPSTAVFSNRNDFNWRGKPVGSSLLFGIVSISHDFGKTIGWRIKEGRDFSKNFGTDTSGFILNEAAVKITGFKKPIGETITLDDKNYKVIGVINDMVMESPFEPIKPTIFLIDRDWVSGINIRLKHEVPVRDALRKIENVFRKAIPASPFEYNFVDEDYSKKFSTETRIGTLSSVFACLAILISCLGLFGLASFTAEQRTKEIGIRKVVGASVVDLWMLLSRDFVGLVLISLLISMPVSYWFMHNWLLTYSYHSAMSWWIFVFSGFGALTITMATVSFQAIKAALANPVHSLRND